MKVIRRSTAKQYQLSKLREVSVDNLDESIESIDELNSLNESNSSQRLAKLFDVTEEQVENPNYWINL
jgi:hypothetical protein